MTASPGPYATAAAAYWHAGWRGILPLPERRKANPPRGYTGADGTDPAYPDIQAWTDGPEGNGNIALRLPRHIIGVDVDNYGDKHGGQTFTDAETRWGPLPATWRTTSRDDGISGIRLYRAPEGLAWPGELGPATELIQHAHRYAIVWPSVHPEGRTYRWITPDGITSTAIPDPDTLPLLPDAWVEGLTAGQAATDTPRNSYTDSHVAQWLALRPGAGQQPCTRMRRAMQQAENDIRTGSAHATARDGALRTIRLADEGHTGLATALAHIARLFTAEATSPARDRNGKHRRSQLEAEREWKDIVTSATNLVTANPSGITSCDCLGQLTGLAVTPQPPAPSIDGTSAVAPAVHVDDNQLTGAPTPERTSWWPKDLAAVLAGHDDEPAPAYLARTDGARLFYAGKVNGLIGESESGKTWVLLLAVAQTLNDGQHVVYLDFEDTAAGIIARLRALGVTDIDLTRLHYIGPDETLTAAASNDLDETLATTRPALIGLDGFNAAMTLLGLDIDNNGDATRFAQTLLRPLSAGGAAVVYVDHLPKNKDNRGKGGIGAQAKRAMTTGCAIAVDVVQPFGRGMTGRLTLTVDKDRPGHVRAIATGAKNAGVAILTSDQENGSVTVTIEPAENKEAPGDGRGSILMEEISTYLEHAGEISGKQLRDSVKARAGDVDQAVAKLIELGCIVVTDQGPGRAKLHKLIRCYSVADDLAGAYQPAETPVSEPRPATSSDLVPTSSRTTSGPCEGSSETDPPLRGGPRDDVEPSTPHFADDLLVDPRTGEIITPRDHQ